MKDSTATAATTDTVDDTQPTLFDTWLIAGTPAAAPYPCRCSEPGKCVGTGWRTCPCWGQTPHDGCGPDCCRRRPPDSPPATPVAEPEPTEPPPPPQPALPVFRAPVDAEQPSAAAMSPRFASPAEGFARIRPKATTVFAAPVVVLEPWQRQSRRPGPGEDDCRGCGELLAAQLVKVGAGWHIGC